MAGAHGIHVLDSAHGVLQLVEDALVRAGAEAELALGLLNHLRATPDAWGSDVALLVAMDAEEPVALVMQTGVHPALIVGFVDEREIDFAQLVGALQGTGITTSSVNGAVRCSIPFASAWVAATGCSSRVLRELRAFELHTLRPPRATDGSARAASDNDLDLVAAWGHAFSVDIDEPRPIEHARTQVADLIASSDLMLWECDGQPVSMAAINRRTARSSCVAWVYTPPELRGNGYASAVVAALSERELAGGAAWCSLFTDLANPTSNHIYAELGYEPRCDYRHIGLERIDS